MVAFGAAVDEQRFHRDAGSLWRQDGMPANTPTVTPVCRRHWWLIHTRRHVLVKMRVCLSFRGFCHQRLCLCRLGFFCRLILTEDRTERETDMKTWSRLQEKYDLVIQYYRQYYQLDLEQIAKQCQKLTVK